MKILMLSQDMQIFSETPVALRMRDFGGIFDETLIVVFGTGLRREHTLAPNVHAIAPGGENKVVAFFLGLRELLKQSAQKKFDVISSQDPFFLGVAALTVAKKRRLPLQVQLHADCFSSAFTSESLRRHFESLLARTVIRHASCVRVVSERIARSVEKITHAPVSILPIAVSNEVKKDMPNPPAFRNRFTFLAVSRLTKEKQIHLIINALVRVPEADLIVLGEGPLKKSLEFRVRSLGLGGRVQCMGQQDPAAFYAHADAFVQASLHEGYGRTLVEAALAGLPIITTDVGIVGEILRDGEEVLVVAADAESIAKAMQRVVSDAPFAHALGEHAKEAATSRMLSPELYLARYKEVMHTCPVTRT